MTNSNDADLAAVLCNAPFQQMFQTSHQALVTPVPSFQETINAAWRSQGIRDVDDVGPLCGGNA